MQNTLSQHVKINGSYNVINLICTLFDIGGSCTVKDTIKADKGDVGGSLTTRILNCKKFNIGGSCTVKDIIEADKGKVGGSLTTAILNCKKFDVGGSCTVKDTIKADKGDVGGSLTTRILKCKKFDIAGSCTVQGTIEADGGEVGGAMTIKQGGTIKEELFVGSLLTCFNTNINVLVKLYLINAKKSNFKQVYIQNRCGNDNAIFGDYLTSHGSVITVAGSGNNVHATDGSTVTVSGSGNSVYASSGSIVTIKNSYFACVYSFFSWLFYKMTSFFYTVPRDPNQFSDSTFMEEEISIFEDCQVESIIVDKKNNKMQIIQLKNTVVTGNITFAKDTYGEVRSSGSVVKGRIYSAQSQKNDSIYNTIIQNTSAPSM
ncbi:DUF3060 domain-containing protein [Candidatus Dependentiae bacterium]|nr:MAG: DUF3060 domain-containing protein [Candidatus Dependentiae bacterium]